MNILVNIPDIFVHTDIWEKHHPGSRGARTGGDESQADISIRAEPSLFQTPFFSGNKAFPNFDSKVIGRAILSCETNFPGNLSFSR